MVVDSFFVNPSKRGGKKRPAKPVQSQGPRKRPETRAPKDNDDEEITSDSDQSVDSQLDTEASSGDESEDENEADKRRRLAKEYIQNLEHEALDENAFDAQDLDREIISRRLVQDVAEKQGKVFRHLTNATTGPAQLHRTRARNLTGVASLWPYAYTVSKSRMLQKWRLDTENGQPELVKQISASAKVGSTTKVGHTDEIVAVAVNKLYVVTGGLDRKFIVWSSETLEPVKAFEIGDRNGTVLCLAFRQDSFELYVGCGDLRLRSYDLEQMVFVEALYGHQDGVADVSALGQERCVTVGQRDRSVMYWKIPEEARLTFRGGDTKLASKTEFATRKDLTLEGSIDCCTMLDNQFFVTGSDNGNISLWSTQRKKPVHIEANGHGLAPALSPQKASAEVDPRRAEIPPAQPRNITAIAAIPYSDTFFTGSTSGTVNMWRLSEDQRSFSLVKKVRVGKGIVTSLSVAVSDASKNNFTVVASLAREPRLGRWCRVSGHDAIATFAVSG